MLENCRWLLYASRLYGCHPHTIQERGGMFANFRPLMLYSFVACSAYCVAAYHASGIISCIPANAMIVGCALQRIDRYTRGSYMILTALLSCLRHSRFERAVAAARKFDHLTRRHYWPDADDRMNRRTQWLVIIAIHVAWILFGVMGNIVTIGGVSLTIAIQCATRAAFSMQIAKFCSLYDALRRKFCRLDKLCRELTGMNVGVNTGASRIYAKHLTISSLQQLHRCLIDATNHLSSYYSPQLLCWIACMLTDIMTFVFFAIYKVSSPQMVCLQCVMLLYLSLQIISISYVCHLTCDQANALARTVFSVQTSGLKRSEFSMEAIEFGIYLQAHPLSVKVFGLFNFDNQFTFSVFGVLLMYVILASSIH